MFSPTAVPPGAFTSDDFIPATAESRHINSTAPFGQFTAHKALPRAVHSRYSAGVAAVAVVVVAAIVIVAVVIKEVVSHTAHPVPAPPGKTACPVGDGFLQDPAPRLASPCVECPEALFTCCSPGACGAKYNFTASVFQLPSPDHPCAVDMGVLSCAPCNAGATPDPATFIPTTFNVSSGAPPPMWLCGALCERVYAACSPLQLANGQQVKAAYPTYTPAFCHDVLHAAGVRNTNCFSAAAPQRRTHAVVLATLATAAATAALLVS